MGAKCFGKLDLLQGYWQMPFAPEAQEVFTIVTPDGLFTPTRVPQGVLNATSYCQGVMTDLLRGLDCKVWVKVPRVPVRSVAVHSPCDANDSLPSVDVIRAAQRKAVADLGDNLRSFPTTFGQVTCLLYTSPSPRDRQKSRMPSSA